MRFEGSLKKWSPDRGFGFIEASHGGPELFVHVSALTCDGRVPLVGDALSFEVDIDREGRKRAVRVRRSRPVLTLASLPEGHANRRDGGTGAWRPSRPARPARKSGRTGAGFTSSLIGFGIVLALGWFGYEKFSARLQLQSGNGSGQNQPALALPAATPVNPFQCDGRQHCSQMTSCAEAKYFLKSCPGTQMDGDGDGVPCEQQLCTGLFGD